MKLTKKAVLAANEDIQAKIGFKPELNTKLKQDELFAELHQKILDVEIDDEDRDDLEDETCEVIDALAEMFADGAEQVEDAEVVEDEKPKKKGKKEKKSKKGKKVKEEVEEEEEAPEEKPAKKEKKAKGKKVKEEVEEEKPAKKEKKAKGKKSKGSEIAGMDEKELRDFMKPMKKDEILELIDSEPLLSAKADELKAITNFMSFKKNIGLVMQGKDIEVSEPKPRGKKEKKEKKGKKEKVAEKTLTEKVNEFEDFDELKAFAKENKKSFPGVKAKKFSKLKKLRKALLEVIVEDEPKAKKRKSETRDLETIRAERQKRIDWITDFLDEAGGKVGRKKLTAKALEEFPNPAKAIRDLISYAKNPKYNKFEKLMVEVDGVIGWEDVMSGSTKKSKKDKKVKEVEVEEPKKEKKNKKGKKDKKNKKGKKSKK